MSVFVLGEICRGETYPKIIELPHTGRNCYVSITTENWTAQMFYELPALRFDIYVDIDGEIVKERTQTFFFDTNTPFLSLDDSIHSATALSDIPETCCLAVTPIFDSDALNRHNRLVDDNVESGEHWTEETQTFQIKITVN